MAAQLSSTSIMAWPNFCAMAIELGAHLVQLPERVLALGLEHLLRALHARLRGLRGHLRNALMRRRVGRRARGRDAFFAVGALLLHLCLLAPLRVLRHVPFELALVDLRAA